MVKRWWWWWWRWLVVLVMTTTDTKAECQGQGGKLYTDSENYNKLSLTTLDVAYQDTILLHVNLYLSEHTKQDSDLYIYGETKYLIIYRMYNSYYEKDRLKIYCLGENINRTTTRETNRSDKVPRSLILKLESRQVTVTETTAGVNNTQPMICPLKKPLQHPQNYQLSLHCHDKDTSCGYAKICRKDYSVESGVSEEGGVTGDGGVPEEGGIPVLRVVLVVLLVVMVIVMLEGCFGCFYYRRKANANRLSTNNGVRGAGIQEKDQQQQNTYPQQEQYQGETKTTSHTSINSIYQPFQPHTE